MKDLIADLKKQLADQRADLTTSIRNGEENLMRTKEGFLRVEGALEAINLIETRLAEKNKEVVEEVIGTS